MLLLVNVHGVNPPAASILDFPNLARAEGIGSSRCSQRHARLERHVVDQPLGFRDERIVAGGTATLQLEAARGSSGIDVGQIAQPGRDDAVVHCLLVVADDELEYRDAEARTDLGLTSIGHVQDIDEEDLVSLVGLTAAVLILREIDDDLAALGRKYSDRVAKDRVRQQSAFAGDLRELHALL